MGNKLKKIQNNAPHLIDEATSAKKVLEEMNLHTHIAQVALCLDISGTMHHLYAGGDIQKFAEKVLALGSRFGTNAVIDIFLFGDRAYNAGKMDTTNFHDFIEKVKSKYQSVGGTYYGKAINLIRNHYFPHEGEGKRDTVLKTDIPVYVMFLTDGTTIDEKYTMEQLIWASYEPIFWQFMAIGKCKKDYNKNGFWNWLNQRFAEDFSFLRKLDNMKDRCIDNANFFNVISPLAHKDVELYKLMMDEYPEWIEKAKEKGMFKD